MTTTAGWLHLKTFVAALFCCLVAAFANAAAAEKMSPAEIAEAVGFTEDDKTKVLDGKVAAADLPETTDKMLAQAIAVFVPAPVEDVAKEVLSGRIFQAEIGVLASGAIDPSDPQTGLKEAIFTADDEEEAERLRDARPGSEFNLSSAEYKRLQSAVASGAESAQALSEVYRAILAERVRTYAAQGLDGIAPYDRGDGETVSAAGDLKAAAEAAKALRTIDPELYASFVSYPQKKQPDVTERFRWVKRNVEDRPTFILIHQMIVSQPRQLVVLQRDFFVGHSYNAAQSTSAALPVEGGTVVFSGTRSMTDQVAGFMSGTRHKIGRGMMRDEMIDRFKGLQSKF